MNVNLVRGAYDAMMGAHADELNEVLKEDVAKRRKASTKKSGKNDV